MKELTPPGIQPIIIVNEVKRNCGTWILESPVSVDSIAFASWPLGLEIVQETAVQL